MKKKGINVKEEKVMKKKGENEETGEKRNLKKRGGWNKSKGKKKEKGIE